MFVLGLDGKMSKMYSKIVLFYCLLVIFFVLVILFAFVIKFFYNFLVLKKNVYLDSLRLRYCPFGL